jgi:hypothetical protein
LHRRSSAAAAVGIESKGADNTKMNWRKYLVILAAVAFCYSGRVCRGVGIPSLRISDLINDSDVVVVAEEDKLTLIGSSETVIGGQSVTAQRYQAQAVAKYFLKGSCPERFKIELVYPESSPGYIAFKSGIRLLFLKKLGDTYVPTSPYYPDLPAVSSKPILANSETLTDSVFAVLTAVVASPEASVSDKLEVLARSYAIPRSYNSYLAQLQVGLQNTSDPDLKVRLQAELVGRDDVSVLSTVCKALQSDTLSKNQKEIFLYVISERSVLRLKRRFRN